MTLDDIMRDIQAMREDLLVFERKYGVPTELFYEAYRRGEEPDDPAWVLDWSEWAATQQLLQGTAGSLQQQWTPELSFTRPNLPFLIGEIEHELVSNA